MRAYINLKKDQKILDGGNDFIKLGEPVLYPTLDELLTMMPKAEHIAFIEFTDKEEILNAIMATYMGSHHAIFNIKVLEVFHHTCL